MSALVNFFLGLVLVLTALFLILLVLIQRGRGGGLAGAFGGAGGQSAFGTKAGDVFTKITVGVATFWIVLCVLAFNVLGRKQSAFSPSLGGAANQTPVGTAPLDAAGGAVAPGASTVAPGASTVAPGDASTNTAGAAANAESPAVTAPASTGPSAPPVAPAAEAPAATPASPAPAPNP
ncbi:MAG: preprotein translocase subunit SecG [Pirellulales bacterium]